MNDLELFNYFPNLKYDPNFECLSEATIEYNCIAYSLGFIDYWVWPTYSGAFLIQNRRNCTKSFKQFWPIGLDKNLSLNTFIELYKLFGYELCEDDNISYERGYKKVILYGFDDQTVNHAAVVCDGYCISKVGGGELIKHSAKTITGDIYGEILIAVRRKTDIDISDREILDKNRNSEIRKIITVLNF